MAISLWGSDDVPNSTYIIPSAIHPFRSLFGRWIRAHSSDDRQAESTYVVAAICSICALILLHVLAWPLFRPADTASFFTFLAGEGVLWLVYSGLVLAGRAPAIEIRAEPSALVVSRGVADEVRIPYDEMEDVGRVDARVFHRHYRRYAQTRAFVNRTHGELLLLRWKGVPVVLGPAPADLRSLERLLIAAVSRSSSHVGAT